MVVVIALLDESVFESDEGEGKSDLDSKLLLYAKRMLQD